MVTLVKSKITVKTLIVDSFIHVLKERGILPLNKRGTLSRKYKSVTELIAWLEEDVGEAVEKNYLEKCIIGIFKDDIVLESYTFIVRDQKLTCSDFIAILPVTIKLGMQLVWNNNAPLDYNPPRFRDYKYNDPAFEADINETQVSLKIYSDDSNVVPATPEMVEEYTDEFRPRDTQPMSASTNEKVVKCACGDTSSQATCTIKCIRCSNWKHIICEGYFGRDDKRLIPAQFACGNCHGLATDKETSLMRRALASIYRDVGNKNELASAMNVDIITAGEFDQRMKKEGFISRGFKAIKSNETKAQIKEYFQPPHDNTGASFR